MGSGHPLCGACACVCASRARMCMRPSRTRAHAGGTNTLASHARPYALHAGRLLRPGTFLRDRCQLPVRALCVCASAAASCPLATSTTHASPPSSALATLPCIAWRDAFALWLRSSSRARAPRPDLHRAPVLECLFLGSAVLHAQGPPCTTHPARVCGMPCARASTCLRYASMRVHTRTLLRVS